MANTQPPKPRMLLAIDCDHTIIDGNSDTWIMALLPDHMVPKDIRRRLKNDHKSWTIYMGEVFEYMKSVDIKEDAIRASIAGIPLVPGMKELLAYQQSSSQVDTIIVSDSNSYFINVILATHGFEDGVQGIFTNHAEFDSEGCLRIHFSNPHTCPRRCPKNLCKHTSIQKFREEQESAGVVYDKICMIGDGQNDLCPCFFLKESDYVFPRKGYTLAKLLAELQNGQGEKCLASVVPWSSATEILDVVKTFVDSGTSC
ncbi:pyridoxal phosphate phosphatase PHOSPHO2-like [Diadema antillarum]|uniref:pyridoxal phosphate phosphatase PHOSPHO2-like n=1 Tax=Diadema antillarum TaxID=105358 RepID=UPI003A8B1EDD